MTIYTPYVYRFTQISTGMWYIGVRFKRGCHPNDGYKSSSKTVRPLVESCPDDWIKEVVATGTKDEMVELEQFILEELDAARDPMSFNRHNATRSSFHHIPLTEETRQKLSLAAKNRVRSEETRQKIAAARLGTKRSPESCRKMAESARKRPPISEETRRKLSEASSRRTGGVRSEESRRKMSEAAKNRPPISEETRRRKSEASKAAAARRAQNKVDLGTQNAV